MGGNIIVFTATFVVRLTQMPVYRMRSMRCLSAQCKKLGETTPHIKVPFLSYE